MGFWASILGLFGKAPGEPSSAFGGKVVEGQPIWDQASSFAGGATASGVTSTLREADGGKPKRLIDLVNSFRQKDGHIHACLTTVELDIASLAWTAIPQGGTPGKTSRNDRKLAMQVEAAVNEIAGWHEAKAHMAGSGEINGHATVELEWGLYQGNNKLLRGWFLPIRAHIIHPNRFGFASANGELRFDAKGNQNFDADGVDLLTAYPSGKFVQHRPRVNGDIESREGVSRLLAWSGFFRNWTSKDYMLSAELGWKPTKLVTYSKDAGDEDIALAKTIAERMTPAGSVAKPATVQVELGFAKNSSAGNNSQHRALLEYLGQEVSKALLGHTLLLESGDRGARSLGEVGYKMAASRRDARAIALAATVNAHLIRPLVRINAGTRQCPLYLPDIKGGIDLAQFAQAVDTLAKRMKVPASWVREQGRVPEPQADEEILDMGYQPDGIQGTEKDEDTEIDVPVTVDGEDEGDAEEPVDDEA
jgi:phage gp29-like protein